ncbi:hypothetical protein N9R24_04910 [Amylibacter sp.]|nr:hypothetical protein [Amylibacter sp.]
MKNLLKIIFYTLHLHIIFEFFIAIRIYFLANKSKKNEINKGNKVYIVATGPSLDLKNLKQLDNTTIIFLNSAIQLEKYIKKSNNVYWFVSDNRAVLEYQNLRPSNIKLILVISDLFNFRLISHFLKPTDRIYLPILTFGQEWWKSAKYSRFRIIPSYLGNPNKTRRNISTVSSSWFQLYSGTVSANALMFCYLSGANEITVIGIDLLSNPKNFLNYSDALETTTNLDIKSRLSVALPAARVIKRVAKFIQKNGVQLNINSQNETKE